MSTSASAAEIVRAAYEAFAARDRSTMESLISDDFTFTSPYDDHIDRATYFDRCWPGGEVIQEFRIVSVIGNGPEVALHYDVTPKSGPKFRNAERLIVEHEKIKSVEVFFGALPTPAEVTDTGEDLAVIRDLIGHRAEALRSRDIDGLYAQVAAENVAYDVVNPLQYVGASETKARAQEWLGSFDGPVGYETRELQIAAAGNVGVAYCLTRISGMTPNGALNMWLRSTTAFRKLGGTWTVVHEHNSVPFDPMTGKASLGLEP